MDTADQDAWLEIARGIREGIRQRSAYIPAMTPDEIKALVEAAADAYWLTVNAATLDKRVELEHSRITAAD